MRKTTFLKQRQTEPGLVVFYDIQTGNEAGLFLQPHSPHGTFIVGTFIMDQANLSRDFLQGC